MLVFMATIGFVSDSFSQITGVSISAPTNICNNGTGASISATLTGTPVGPTTYLWTTTGDGTFTNSSAQSTTYVPGANDLSTKVFALSVEVDDNGNIQNASGYSVNINNAPTISAISNNGPKCEGVAINLLATTADGDGTTLNFAWTGSNGFTASTEDATISNPVNANDGSYTLTITDDNNCSASSSTTVTVHQKPIISAISNDGPKCEGSSINLNATTSAGDAAISTYSWSGGSLGFTASTEDATINSVVNTHEGVYTLTIEDGNGCTVNNTTTVVVHRKPTIFPISNNGPKCEGLNIDLTATTYAGDGAISSYTWSGPSGFAASTEDAIINSVVNANEGSYTLTLVDANGCTVNTSTAVVVYTKPTISAISNNGPKCEGLNINLNASTSAGEGAISSYTWAGSNGFSASTEDAIISSAVNANDGSYTLTVEDANGCSVSNSTTVVVYQKATISAITNNGPKCEGLNIDLNSTVSAGDGAISSYTWAGSNGFSASTEDATINSVVNAHDGSYTLTVLDANGCSINNSTSVVVNQKPTISAISNNGPKCEGLNIDLNSTITVGDGAISTYTWSGSNGFSASTEDATINSVVNANDGSYTLTLLDANGCSVSNSTTVVVHQKPTISAISNNGPKCEGLNINLNATTSAGDGAISSYTWAGSNGFTASTEDAIINSVVNANDGSYTLTVLDANGCSVNNSTTVTVYQNPTASYSITESSVIPNDNIICSTSSASFNGSASLLGDGSSITTYAWLRGVTPVGTNSNSYSTSTAGSYTLRVTDNLGCSNTSSSQTLTVNSLPSATIGVNDADQCINGVGYAGNNSFNFSSTNTTNIANYAWNLGDGIGASSGASNSTYNSYVYGDEGTYTVTLTLLDNNGCTNTANRNVFVRPKPVVSFASSSALQQCLSTNSFVFTNGTTLSDGTPNTGTSYSWNFRNGSLGTGATPTKVYTADGHYTVTLTATTTHGCIDSFNRVNYLDVWPSPNIIAGTSSTISGGVSANAGQLLCTSKVIFTNASTINEGSIVNYTWNFNDGSPIVSTTSQDNLKHEFPIKAESLMAWGDPGYPNVIRSILVTATSDRGCVSTSTITRHITNAPTAVISMSFPTTQCLNGNAFNFRNASTNHWPSFVNGNKWTWGNGDTNITTVYNDYNYATEGSYRVHLISYASTGCTDTTFMDVNVLSAPTASYTHNASCTNSVSFTDQSVHATSYSWDFGNGTTSTLANPSVTYAAPGAYHVKLTINGSNSCGTSASLDSQLVVVGNVPSLSFTTATDNCNNRMSFTNTSTSASGTPSYIWRFGDGDTSILANPTHNYLTGGSKSVVLEAVSSTGCSATTTQSVTATAFNTNVIDADFTITQADLCVNTVSLANTSLNSTVSTTYQYSIDSGTFQTITSFPVVLSSLTNGSHFIIFRATEGACVSNEIKSFNLNRDVTPAFTVGTQQSCNTLLSFANTTSGTGPFTYYWNFDDGGANSTSINPSHTFSAGGTFEVELTAITSVGCSTTVSQNVVVNAPATSGPTASFTNSTSGGCAAGYNFTNTSTGATSYLWDFGDGSTSNVANPTKGYGATGTFTVTLTAYNGSGCQSVTSSSLVVTSVANGPLAGFTIENTGQCGAGAQFSFLNTSSHVGPGWIPTSIWDFGDGTTSTNTFVYGKTYSSTGYKTITLTVVNSAGCSSSYSRILYVGTAPTASFTPSYTACSKTVSFTNSSSTGAGISYSWNFGDGSTSTSTNPSITYATVGSYDVTLTVNNQGCIATSTQTVEVGSTPTVSFTDSIGTCANNIVFVNNSSVDYGDLTYSWDFGDGTSSTLETPIKAYASSGTKSVTLTATNSTGCSISSTRSISAVAATQAPISSFTHGAVETSCTNTHTFTNTSSVSTGVPTYRWDFGNGDTSISASPTVRYNYPGTYLVSLTVNDGVCSTVYTENIHASVGHSGPIVQFTTPLATQCISSNRFDFSNSTYFIGWGWVNNGYTWNFGDGTTSTSTFHYGKTYAAPGTYTVTLNAVSMAGCAGSATMNVTVVALPCTGLSVVTMDDLPTEISKDGEIKAAGSDVTGVSSVTANSFNINLYPNPNTGSFTISVADMVNYKDVDVVIVDMLGRSVYNKSHDLRNENSIEFRNLNLDAGKYHVILSNGNKVIGRAFFAVAGQ